MSNFKEMDKKQRDAYYRSAIVDCLGSEMNTQDRCGWIKQKYKDWGLQGSYILDIACRDGFVTRRFLEDDCEIMGFDICEDAIKKATEVAKAAYPKKKHHYYNLSIEQFPWITNEGLFDLVVCFELIEHITPEEVAFLMDKMQFSLKPGGYACISTPHKNGKYGDDGDDPTHINCYDEKRLHDQILVTTGRSPEIIRDGEFLFAYWRNVKNED